MSEIWTIQKLIGWTATHFTSKQIPSARLDAEILLSHTLKCRRLDLYLKFDQPLKEEELKIFKGYVQRRAQREPVAYITGTQEFYGRPFSVGPGVLIPRPETEHIIDEALKWIKGLEADRKENFKILDVGSGSGCIAVTLALEIPEAHVTAIDISEVGFAFTKMNAAQRGVGERVSVENRSFNDFKFTELFDLIVSNPPYIGRNTENQLQEDVAKYEPPQALFGGELGHEILEAWIPPMAAALKDKGLLLCELGFDQGEKAISLAEKEQKFGAISLIKDYSGHHRILRAAAEHRGENRG